MEGELTRRRRVIEVSKDRFPRRAPRTDAIAPEVAASWERCRREVPARRDAVTVDEESLRDRWESSAIRRAAPDLTTELSAISDTNDMVATITDPEGRLLWLGGTRSMRREAERVNFVAGGRWDERSAGTNAIAMALITGAPSTVFSAEHWIDGVQNWVCYAAPVRDGAGELVGVIDLSGMWSQAHPLGAVTINALARVVEQALAVSPVGATTPALGLRVLGRPHVRLASRGEMALTMRQLEILTVLASVEAVSLDELHAFLYGDRPVSASTLKAEISHLRRRLGPGTIASRPYRLTIPIEVDYLRVLDDISGGHLDEAAAHYRGQLLPLSEAPFLIERRHHLDVALRTAVLAGRSLTACRAYLDIHPLDAEVLDHALAVAPSGDPLVADLTARRAVAIDLG